MTHGDQFYSQPFDDLAERIEWSERSPTERQDRIQRTLIRYPLFEETIAKVGSFHMPVVGGLHGRGVIGGLLGESRAGKSWAIKYYTNGLGLVDRRDAVVPRALYVDCSKGATSHAIGLDLYARLNLRTRPRLSSHDLFRTVSDEIQEYGIELLVIDDAQFALVSADKKTVKEVLGFIVRLAERNCCNILLAGTNEIYGAIERDAHAMNRGSFPCKYIDAYDWRSEQGRKRFRGLLSKIDSHMPFRNLSGFAEPETAAHFYSVSRGLIGIVMNYVKDAAFMAMNEQADCIERRHLAAAADTRRRPNDPFQPFRSTIDENDPTGAVADREAELLGEAEARGATLSKRSKPKGVMGRPRSPSASREQRT